MSVVIRKKPPHGRFHCVSYQSAGFSPVVCVPINNPRTLTEIELSEKCKDHFNTVTAEKDIFKAFDYAYNKAKENNYALLICGSLYLAGNIRPYAIKISNS